MPDFRRLRELADECMRSKDYSQANSYYCAAWNDYAEQRINAEAIGDIRTFDERHTANEAFWLLLSGANAQFLVSDYDGCIDTAIVAYNLFKELGFVVGNPFFHLRFGQASYELESQGKCNDDNTTIDNLARALICGGIEIFKNEDPKYLDSVVKVLRPPKGFNSWANAIDQGCSIDKLNGATGFLLETFTLKYGVPPPYREA